MSGTAIKYKKVFATNGGVSGGGGGTVVSVNSGTNISVDNTDPANPIINSTVKVPIEVANYSALPTAGTSIGQTYIVLASQGTSWLPGSLGGTYYSKGYYYDNGASYTYSEVPYQATQAEVNTGTNDDKFVTPSTLTNATVITNKELLSNKQTDLTASATKYPTVNAVNAGLSLNKLRQTVRTGSLGVFSPFDSTTMYIGCATPLTPNATAINRSFELFNATIRTAWIWVEPTGTLGTPEDVTYNLRNITDATSTLLGTVRYDARGNATFVEGLSIAVVTGKDYSIEIVNPPYSTNPTNCYTLCEIGLYP